MIQDFIDRHFYSLFLVTLIFGVLFYGLIGFQSIDEVCGVLLFCLFLFNVLNTKDWQINKAFLFTLSIFGFYLCYSLYIQSNSTKAILVDFIIQLKPYLAFFCVYQLKPKFDTKKITLLKQTSVACWLLLLPIGLAGILNPKTFVFTMGHASNYASAVAAVALVYFYTSKNTPKDRIIFIIMMTLGLISGRAKFYGFFVFASVAALYLSNPQNIKLSVKNVVGSLAILSIIIFVAKDKIALYFLQGISEDAEIDYIARFALYATSFQIFLDYLPLGCGFASFATHASGLYYSNIYTKYQIDGVWGLSKSYNSFVSDTYYPSLAQFGIVGVILFVCFWIYLIKKAYLFFKTTRETKLTIITIIIVGYFAIENIADATFTSNRGFFFMMFLGLIVSNMKSKIAEINNNQNP